METYEITDEDVIIIRQALDLFARQNCCGGKNTRARELIGVFKLPARPERHKDNLLAGLSS